MRVYEAGLRKKPRTLPLVSTRHSPRQFPLHPYTFYALTMRWMIPGVLLLVLGAEAVFGSFLLSLLGVRRR
jgi:hypothetical protein